MSAVTMPGPVLIAGIKHEVMLNVEGEDGSEGIVWAERRRGWFDCPASQLLI